MTRYQNIVFDLDGTLVDSFDDIRACLEKAYATVDAAAAIAVARGDLGPPVREMIRRITPGLREEDVDKVFRAFRALYDHSDLVETKAYAGARELLHELKAAGRRLFLMTNKPEVPTRRIIGFQGLAYFEDLITPDKDGGAGGTDKSGMLGGLIHTWGLDRQASVMVGDAASDIIAARENRIGSIGVTYGYGGGKEVTGAGPDHSAGDIASLRRILLT